MNAIESITTPGAFPGPVDADMLKAIFEAMPVCLVVYRAMRNDEGLITDYKPIYLNQRAVTVCGKSRSSILASTLQELFPDIQDSTLLTDYRAVTDSGASRRQTHFLPSFGGWFDVSVSRLAPDELVATFIDVSEQRRHEQHISELKSAAEQQTDMLRSVLDGSQNAIIAFESVRNENGRIVDFRYVLQNEVNRQRVGRPDEVLLGRTMLEFFPEVGSNGLLEKYIQVVETGEMQRFELEFTYQNQPGWYDYSLVRRGDGIVMTVHDKTTERQARLTVERANAELQKVNENLQQFAYVASHDLQEPLRKIRAFGDIVLQEYSPLLPERGQDMLRRMQSAADRMSGLIRDVLGLSRLTIQKQFFEPADLNEILAGVLSDLETAITETEATIDVMPLPVVNGDGVQLSQLLQNLLSNALKFRREDQPPHVRVQYERLDWQSAPIGVLPAAAREQGQFYHAISVQDNGIGFDADRYGERIFGAFQRLHGRSDSGRRGGAPSGTGIGLAIVKKVAENHGGSIMVRSREGEGATFTVLLPVDES